MEKESKNGFTFEDGGIYTGLSPHTLRYYVSRGLIPYCKPGKRVLLLKEDLDRFLRDHRMQRRRRVPETAA